MNRPNLVRRDRVVEILDHSTDARAVCLQAPGGYGKTTVLAQWLAEDPRPAVWLNVGPEAADAGWVAQALMDGLGQARLLASSTTLPLIVDPIGWTTGVVPAVRAALASIQEPFVLVVDDVGELAGPAWDLLLDSIVRGLPPRAQLVVATRSAVPKPLRRLRPERALVTIGPDTLALDAIEGARLLGLLGVAPPDPTLRWLLEETEGWPAAFCLAAMALGPRPGTGVHQRSLTSVEDLADYFRDEILDRLDPADSSFLLHTSVLTYLDESTCDSVTGDRASLAQLRRLAEANHLLVPLDPEHSVFRMHGLLASFLSDEFRATDPVAWRTAHARASVLREEEGDLDAAAHHAKLAGDDTLLGELLWRHAGRALATSQAAVLRRWLAGVPDDRLSRVCELALCASWLASHEGDMARMERMAVVAEALCSGRSPALAAYVDLLKATLDPERTGQMATAAESFIALSAPDDPWLTLAHFLRGIALALAGQAEAGLASLERGHRLARAFELPVMDAHCLAAQADIWLARAQPGRALPLIREARRIIDAYRLDHIATTAPIFTTSAAGYLAEGRLLDARREAVRALGQTSRMRAFAPWYAVQGRVTLAEVFLALGDGERAHELLDEAEGLHGPVTESPLLDEALARARRRISLSGPPSSVGGQLTIAEIRVVQYLPTHLSFPQIAGELTLSAHTVKSQAMSAYRKLGAHTRGEAIRRARDAGLLPPG